MPVLLRCVRFLCVSSLCAILAGHSIGLFGCRVIGTILVLPGLSLLFLRVDISIAGGPRLGVRARRVGLFIALLSLGAFLGSVIVAVFIAPRLTMRGLFHIPISVVGLTIFVLVTILVGVVVLSLSACGVPVRIFRGSLGMLSLVASGAPVVVLGCASLIAVVVLIVMSFAVMGVIVARGRKIRGRPRSF